MLLLGYHWSSGEGEGEELVAKALSRWSPEEVQEWMQHLGPWAQLYTHRFLEADVNGRYTHTSNHVVLLWSCSGVCLQVVVEILWSCSDVCLQVQVVVEILWSCSDVCLDVVVVVLWSCWDGGV